MNHRISIDQLEFLVTIILGGDSLNNTFFFLKEQDTIYMFFFFLRKILRLPQSPGVTE